MLWEDARPKWHGVFAHFRGEQSPSPLHQFCENPKMKFWIALAGLTGSQAEALRQLDHAEFCPSSKQFAKHVCGINETDSPRLQPMPRALFANHRHGYQRSVMGDHGVIPDEC